MRGSHGHACPRPLSPAEGTCMSATDTPPWAVRLRTEREGRSWAVPEMARQLRQAAGGTLPDMDSLVRMIKKWEAGKHLPGERYQLLYAKALGLTRERIFGVREGDPVHRAKPRSVVMTADEVTRFGAWAESTNVGQGTLAYYADAVTRLAHDYLREEPALVLSCASELARSVFGLLREGHQRLDQTRDLYATAAKLCALMAWGFGDLGRMREAEAHARTALILADHAGVPAVRALALSVQSKTAFWDGRHAQAAALARQGYEYSPNDTMKVFLACQEADAWQELGDVPRAKASLRSVERARAAVDREDEVGGLFSCGLARQFNYTMAVHLRAADTDAAIAAAEQALEVYSRGEEWAYGTWAQIRIGMAHAYLISREFEGAVDAIAPVLAQPPALRLAPVVSRVSEIGRLLTRTRYHDLPLARSLRDQIDDYQADRTDNKALGSGAGERIPDV